MGSITNARAAVLSIGELSRQAGVHIETIRYYEKIKMLPAPPRTEGGRRAYEPEHTRTLSFIRRSRELGFTLDEIRALIGLNASKITSCAEVKELASSHLESVRAKLSDLTRLERILAQTVMQCAGNLSSVCPVLDMLNSERVA